MSEERKAEIPVILQWPIDIEGGAQIAKLTVRRPKGRTIKKVIALIGPEAIKSVLANVDVSAGGAARDIKERIVAEMASFATPEKLEGLTAIIADLTGQTPAVIDEVDPEDYPRLFEAIAGFFPTLFTTGSSSDGEASPQT